MYREMTVSGWGRVKAGTAMVARPERVRDVYQLFDHAGDRQICARGAGRSYGDCGLNSGGILVDTERLARILSFDERSGEIAVEPGVSFERLLRVFLPRNWLVPVSPGTAFVTVGGAIANDVHGKNHERAGSFGQHVLGIEVVTPDGSLHQLSPDSNPGWFRATIGGMGLTGMVTRIAFRMMRVPGPGVIVTEKRIPDLDAFFSAMEEAKDSTYSVGWIDALARGKSTGRGILETAEPAASPCARRKPGPDVAIDFPGFALNGLTTAAFNALYYRTVPAGGRVVARHYADFLYPLDRIGHWNRIYGRRGFHQLQCVIPGSQGPKAIAQLLDGISRARAASFLAVIKRLGTANRAGFLSFPMQGYTLAVDFPNGPGVIALYADLARIVRDHGGRIYLAKDALLSPDDFESMYPELPRFRDAAAQMDPKGRMGSDIDRRLKIRQPA